MPHLTRRNRRGFTLAELIVAMVLFGIIGMSLFRVLLNTQRAFDTQAATMDLQQNLRDAAALLPNELRELDAADGDIIAMSDTLITIRSMRQLGFMCSPPVLGTALPLSAKTFTTRPLVSAIRPFVVGDSLLFFYEGDPNVRTDDGWVLGKLTAISNVAVRCTGDPVLAGNITATVYTADLANPPSNTAGYITTGSPVRGFQLLTYKKYLASDGKYYLAIMLNNTGTPQPIIGPLAGSTGLAFSYYDVNGAVTATTTSVAQIRVYLKVQTPRVVQQGNGVVGPASDAINLAVTLRNNPRF